MDVVWHDGETVELELSLLMIAQESFEEEFGVCFFLEVAMLEEGRDGDGVGVGVTHGGKHTSGLKPVLILGL